MFKMFIKSRKFSNNFETLLHYFGDAGLVVGLVILLPIFVAFIYKEYEFVFPFFVVGVSTIFVSLLLIHFCKRKSEMTLKLSMYLAVFLWLYFALIAAFPYFISGELSFLNAYFEAMSGLTTTGYSMFPDTGAIPYTINFWRGFTQWFGGLGIIFMVLSLMQVAGNDVTPLYQAEGRNERIFPSIRHTTKLMLVFYLCFTAVGIICFIIAGMPVFDSVFYTFTALSGGGFATSNNSIFQYDSFRIEVVAMVLMILGATNFNLHFMVFKGHIKEYFKDIETKVFLTVLIVSTLFLTILLLNNHVYGASIFENFRFALFQVVSAITTTGLQTSFPAQLHQGYYAIGTLVLTIIMIIGAGTGSTGGGIKWYRIGVMVKSIKIQILHLLKPSKAIVHAKYYHLKKHVITDQIMKNTLMFILIYLIVFVLSTMIVLIYYNDFSGVLFEIASAMGNVGLSDGLMTYQSPSIAKIVYIIDFWIGRLEIWPVLIVIYSILRKFKKVGRTVEKEEKVEIKKLENK